jgi:uncharacterized protein
MSAPYAQRFTPPRADQLVALRAIVVADAALMQQLAAVRSLGLAQWCIAAGSVRNRVWDHLHGHPGRHPPGDIDVLYFDADALGAEAEAAVEARLHAALPGQPWEAVNQAGIHAYTGDPQPYASIAQALSRWVDPMTAVGVWLDAADRIGVIAPFGLDDLFALRVRPHLAAPRAAAIYRQRVANKRWTDRWPRVQVEPLPAAADSPAAASAAPVGLADEGAA